jgi:hypothetical protein
MNYLLIRKELQCEVKKDYISQWGARGRVFESLRPDQLNQKD